MTEKKQGWLVVNCSTGKIDGVYYSLEIARESLAGWRETYPLDNIVLCALIDDKVADPEHLIADRAWLGGGS